MRLAMGTAMEVRTALLFSSAMLLQYHTSDLNVSSCSSNHSEEINLPRRTEGALVPQVIMKVAK